MVGYTVDVVLLIYQNEHMTLIVFNKYHLNYVDIIADHSYHNNAFSRGKAHYVSTDTGLLVFTCICHIQIVYK